MSKYLLALLSFIFILISCDDNQPSYNQLELDENEILFDYAIDEKIAGQKEINIVKGNGNYMLSLLSNDLTSIEAFDKINEIEALGGNADTIVVATIKLVGNTLVVTPKYTGTIQYQLQDWAKSSQILTITVDQDKLDEEIVVRSSIFNLRVGDKASTEIYSGNGGYKVESLDPSIAIVNLEDIKINITAIAAGSTEIKVTDQKGKEATINVNIDDALVPLVLLEVEEGKKTWLTTGGVDKATFKYEGGNGELKANSTDVDVVINEDDKTITISGKTARKIFTLIISDRYGQKMPIDLAVDYPFLENNSSRLYRNDTFSTFKANELVAEYIPSLNLTFMQSYSTSSWLGGGVGITFSGEMTEGTKTNARIYNVDNSGTEISGTEIAFSKCKVEKKDNKVFWITFTQKESNQEGYIVISTP